MSELKEIPLNQIRESKVALRTVNRTSEDYLQLVDSIKNFGVLNPISVRQMTDPETNEMFYAVCDGAHRFTASVDAGKDSIPAQIVDMEDARVLEAQIVGNIAKIETQPAQYSKQLVKILALNPLMTLNELASRLSRSVQWLQQRLSLTDLPDEVQKLVDAGKMGLANAYALAKLKKPDEILNFLERAQTLDPEVFVGQVNNRVKELREAARQGRTARSEEFAPHPHLQKISEIKSELDQPTQLAVLLKSEGLGDPSHLKAAQVALSWSLHLDKISYEKGKAAFEAEKAAREAAKKKREEERKAAKDAKAKEDSKEAVSALEKMAGIK